MQVQYKVFIKGSMQRLNVFLRILDIYMRKMYLTKLTKLFRYYIRDEYFLPRITSLDELLLI